MKLNDRSVAVVMLTVCLCLPARAHGAPAAGRAAQIAVLVNARNPAADLSVEELRDYYLKRRTRWPDGKGVLLFNHPPGSALRMAFDQAVLGLSREESAAHWIRARIQGKGQPPPSLGSTAALLRIVSRQALAMTYVRADQVPAGAPAKGVKVLRIAGHAPGSDRYPLPLKAVE